MASLEQYGINGVLEEVNHKWEAKILAADGNEFVLNNWLPITLTGNFDGWTMEFTTADLDQAAQIHPLITDLVLYRDNKVFERFRVFDDTDVFDVNHHYVTFRCATYEAIFARRLLQVDWDGESGDQHTLAWRLVRHMESEALLYDIPLNQPADYVLSGTTRSRTIKRGVTIAAALDDLASVDGGFDWWLSTDQNEELFFHVQTPRRFRNLDRDLGWGQGFSDITRDGSAEDYASRVLTIGSQQTVTIPGGNTYPPPPPVLLRTDPMLYGLWEKAFNYSDVLTVATLQDRAKWNLTEATALRATYKCKFEPGLWTPEAFKIGDIFTLNIDSPPRLVKRDPVRVEEIQVEILPDGAENVTVSARAEQDQPDALVAPFAAAAGTVVSAVPSGRSIQQRRIAPEAELGRLLSGLRGRISRQERSGWFG